MKVVSIRNMLVDVAKEFGYSILDGWIKEVE